MKQENKKFALGELNINSAPKSIQEINLRWFYSAPFFSEFLFRFKYETSDEVSTIGVNSKLGTITLVIGKSGWWEKLTDEEREGVLMHEILHLINETHFDGRGKHLQRDMFNVAADMCINSILKKSKINGRDIQLPASGCFIEDIRNSQKDPYTGREVTEEIYEYLMKNAEKIQLIMPIDLIGDGQEENSSDGSQNSKDNGDKEQEKKSDGKGGGDKDEKKKIKLGSFDVHSNEPMDEVSKAVVAEITHVAKMRGWGNMAGDVESYVKRLTLPAISWKMILRSHLKSISTRSIFKRYSWEKTNRRQLPLPGKKHVSMSYILIVDTSGSISDENMEEFFTEIDTISTFSDIRLLQCDTKLTDSGKYKKGDWRKIKIHGRGGTDLSPAFNYIVENGLKNSKVICFTDGEFYTDLNTYDMDVLWCLTRHNTTFEKEYGKRDKVVVIEKKK